MRPLHSQTEVLVPKSNELVLLRLTQGLNGSIYRLYTPTEAASY
ncbi:hypothetical protein PF005_g3049 [Phytophthora fragariae]|uniref:Uncharacterized protein n=2 Tax=Phytophthora TaxID=4783 RepID=A0A6A3NTB1_9STRA|nr:hypothetical protein PR002_g1991 [Phytophthora rubi]KAE9231577.1 hypothetical protein PF005_g3049 [Phytophthora fragariae]